MTYGYVTLDGEGGRQPHGCVATGIRQHEQDTETFVVGVEVRSVRVRVMGQRQREEEDQVEHVEDGQCCQVAVRR